MKNNSKKIGFLIDPPALLHPEKDSSMILMEEAWQRKYEVYYFEQKDLWLENNQVFAQAEKINNQNNLYSEFYNKQNINLKLFDVIFMRKDPPVDMNYIYTTLLLELAENQGVKIINKPSSLRDSNEKLYTVYFPDCCVPAIVSYNLEKFKRFLEQHQDIIIKPLNGMGGMGIFRVRKNDVNLAVIIETQTQNFTIPIMAQKYIPDINKGDKRIIIMHGKAIPYAISRLAKTGETRANLAAGGSWIKAELTARDKWICDQVAPVLQQKGIVFAGIDIIGEYLTEINITSPTCLRQINQAFNINTAAYLFDQL